MQCYQEISVAGSGAKHWYMFINNASGEMELWPEVEQISGSQ